ncbi:hypothetical protein EDD86DRAFT_394 [Gorgonomyces haynaldii]|nr:hypothetical protein EDD86DRAFT_394 [Gorgonomyces haynaldii]
MFSQVDDKDWSAKLQQAIRVNYRSTSPENLVISLASVKPDGTPKIQSIRFCQFHQDPSILLFSCSARNNDMMSVLKGSKTHEIHWNLGDTTFVMTGRMYLVAAPTLAFRFGTPPRKVGCDQTNFEEFWEKIRINAWRNISKTYRASFSWPVSGDIIVPDSSATWKAGSTMSLHRVPTLGVDLGFKYKELDCIEDAIKAQSVLSLDRKEKLSAKEELVHVHNSALDNFCILVFKPSFVDVTVVKAGQIPVRYHHIQQTDKWMVHQVNP